MSAVLAAGSFWQPLAFGLFALGALVPAVLVVVSRNIVHAALWLLLSLASIAGLYLLLDAEFLAALQILVYCGGIIVLFLFAIMLTPGVGDREVRTHNQQLLGGLAAAAITVGVALRLLRDESWHLAAPTHLGETTGRLADAFMGPYVLAFEVTSVILLVAMVGAIVVVRSEPRE